MPPTLLTLTPPDSGWMDAAGCVGRWDLMESTDEETVEAARDVCRACPVWNRCREWVLSLPPREDVTGMAGGLTKEEREKIRRAVRRRRLTSRAEPPKQCTECEETKPATEFYLNTREGRRENTCRRCKAAKKRERRAARRAEAVTS